VARGVNYFTISRRRELAGLKHDPEKACPTLDAGWAPSSRSLLAPTVN
jgi:hypothetical protein